MKQKGRVKRKSTLNPKNSRRLEGKDWSRGTLDPDSKLVRGLRDDKEQMNQKMKALNIDKNILIRMMKEIFNKCPEAADVIDGDLFQNTLKDY